MDISKIEPNSHKYKAEQKAKTDEKRVVAKPLTGGVRVRKKSPTRKFADIFNTDDVSNMKSYLLTDVVMPTIKKLIFDTIRDGAEMLIYGETRPRNGSKKTYHSNYISYDRFSDRDSRDYRPSNGYKQKESYISPFDYEFDSRIDAENVLMELRGALKEYGIVSIADLTELLQITGEYTDNRYGWTNLDNARITRTRDGYVLDLPKARPIE